MILKISIFLCLLVLITAKRAVRLGHKRPNGKYMSDVITTAPMVNKNRNAVVDKEKRWRDATIPYMYGWKGYTQDHKAKIEKAMKSIQDNTCIKFVQKLNHKDYILFVNGEGDDAGACMTEVGRSGGEQKVWLSEEDDSTCITHDTIVHELMHAIGLDHEHNRADRDQYVHVNFTAVDPENHSQFEKVENGLASDYGCPYTYKSVMHYDKESFGLPDGVVTMVPIKDKKMIDIIGNVDDAHPNDYEKINRIYGCHKERVVKGHTCGPVPAKLPCEDTKNPEYAKKCPLIKGKCDQFPDSAVWCLKTCNRCM